MCSLCVPLWTLLILPASYLFRINYDEGILVEWKQLQRNIYIYIYVRFFMLMVSGCFLICSEEEAKKKIYSVCTTTYTGFGALISEELSYKVKGMHLLEFGGILRSFVFQGFKFTSPTAFVASSSFLYLFQFIYLMNYICSVLYNLLFRLLRFKHRYFSFSLG